MFICLFVDLFIFYFNHLGTPTGIYPENFMKIGLDLAEIYRILKNVYLFVSLFVCLLNCFFYFNHLRTPIGIYPENIPKIRLYYAEIYRILKNVYLFICLFVCLFVDLFVFILIILGHPQEYTLKISWGSDLIWLRY